MYYTINDFLHRQGSWTEQVRLLEALILQWGKTDDNRQKIRTCYCSLGNAYYSLGQYQRAMVYDRPEVIDFHQQSIKIKCQIGDRQGEASSLGNLGNAYDLFGQYQCAIDFYQQSIEIKREISDRQGEANSLFNMALTLEEIDEYFNALQNFQQAKLIYKDLKLDNMVKKCNESLRACNRIIADERRSPPPIAQPPKESTIKWYERQKHAKSTDGLRPTKGHRSWCWRRS